MKKLITRAKYDALNFHCPYYMQLEYMKFKRDWQIEGVTVTGTPAQIARLEKKLNLPEVSKWS